MQRVPLCHCATIYCISSSGGFAGRLCAGVRASDAMWCRSWARWFRIRYLDMYGNALRGTIPSTVGALTALRYVYTNVLRAAALLCVFPLGMHDSTPRPWVRIARCRFMRFSINSLSGTIPVTIGGLSALTYGCLRRCDVCFHVGGS